MNKERLLDVADMIENDRLPHVVFDMNQWTKHRPSINPECGTAACIAGYALCAAYGNREAKKRFNSHIGWIAAQRKARRILGLSPYEATKLFSPSRNLRAITREQAVKVLRHAAETGEIDWSIAP